MKTQTDLIIKKLIPVEIRNHVEVLESKQIPTWEYRNKYGELEICSNVAFKVNYKKEIMWVNLYNGIGDRDADIESSVTVTKDFQEMNEKLYYLNSINESEAARELNDILCSFYFEDEDCLHDNDVCFVENIAAELNELQFIIFKEIDRDSVKPEDIEELEAKLQEAKSLYRLKEGKRILQKILADSTAPSSLKEYISAKKIESLSLEDSWGSGDYMPDWGHLLNLESPETTYSFVMNSSECFIENYFNITDTFFIAEDYLFDSLLDDFSQDFIDKFKKEAVWDYLATKVYAPNWMKPFIEQIIVAGIYSVGCRDEHPTLDGWCNRMGIALDEDEDGSSVFSTFKRGLH